MSLAEVIADSYNQILLTEGVEVFNKSSNTSFFALVSSGEMEALFTIADQDITDTLQITTLKEYRPKTGNKIIVADKDYTVKEIKDRVGSPLIRILVER